MGLLPIFLALAGFIFLWSLVNYNSFAIRKKNIEELSELEELFTKQLEEAVQKLTTYLSTIGISIPSFLLYRQDAESNLSRQQQISELFEQWQYFTESYPQLSADPTYSALMEEFETVADKSIRTQLRKEALVNEYNRLRNQMPFRIIAELFGFKTIKVTT